MRGLKNPREGAEQRADSFPIPGGTQQAIMDTCTWRSEARRARARARARASQKRRVEETRVGSLEMEMEKGMPLEGLPTYLSYFM